MDITELISENDIRKEIKDWLDLHRFFHFHILQGLGVYKGIPDIIAARDGIILFIEIKKLTGKQSKWQKIFEKDLKYRGGHYVLARGYKDVENYFNGIVNNEF